MDFVLVLVSISLILIDFFVIMVYNDGIQLLLQNNRHWVLSFLLWMVILFFQTAFYSWLPGRIGTDLYLFDGLIVLEDGALIRNLGYMIIAHYLGIVCGIAKYLWKVVRGKDRLNWKLVLLEIAFGGVFCFLAVLLIRSEYVLRFEGGETIGTTVMSILSVVGGAAVFLGFRKEQKEKEQTDQSAAQKEPSKNTILLFEQIITEKNRLAEKGDYASQIPLMIEALELDVDVTRKSRICNILGLAYQKIDCEEKAVECFQSAKRIDPDNPSSYGNLALYYAGKGEYNTAFQNADTAIKKAKKRNTSLGSFYGNMALIAGQSGDLKKAKIYLGLAKDAGVDKEYIASLQKRLGIH